MVPRPPAPSLARYQQLLRSKKRHCRDLFFVCLPPPIPIPGVSQGCPLENKYRTPKSFGELFVIVCPHPPPCPASVKVPFRGKNIDNNCFTKQFL